jgi:hypothetical protein
MPFNVVMLGRNTKLNSKETEIIPFNVVMLGWKHRVKQ